LSSAFLRNHYFFEVFGVRGMAEEVKTLPQEKKSAAINELGINLAERNE
jgi:hypothetical protein